MILYRRPKGRTTSRRRRCGRRGDCPAGRRIPSDVQLAEARRRVGGRLVELDRAATIRFRRPGMRINLGSIGKGHALDVASQRLTELGVADFLFHGGQSSVLARGFLRAICPTNVHPSCGIGRSASATPPAGPATWASCGSRTVPWGRLPGNSNPFGIGGTAMDTSSIRTGLAGRGDARVHGGGPHGHTGRCLVDGLLRHGSEPLARLLSNRPEIGAVLTCQEAGSGPVEIHTVGLGEHEVVMNETSN